MKTSVCLSSLALALALTACSGGDDNNNGPEVELADAAVPDAAPQPDASCDGEFCDGVCVDTSSDSLNCGGCGLTCDSPGRICSGALPCECPADFLPASVGGLPIDMVMSQGDLIFGIAPLLSGQINAFVVIWDNTLETGVEYDLANAIETITPPAVAAAYDVNQADLSAQTIYGATTGTIVFDTLCDEGATGTITGPVLSEVSGGLDFQNIEVVEGGCTLSYETLSFSIGTCPDN